MRGNNIHSHSWGRSCLKKPRSYTSTPTPMPPGHWQGYTCCSRPLPPLSAEAVYCELELLRGQSYSAARKGNMTHCMMIARFVRLFKVLTSDIFVGQMVDWNNLVELQLGASQDEEGAV